MPLVSTASIVAAAPAGGTRAAAFNVVQLEQVEAVLDGADRAGRPVVLQISENAARFHAGLAPLAHAAVAAAAASPAQASVHLDHATGLGLAREAIALGLSSVMLDASALPYEDNVALTREAVALCHAAGVWVEAELGEVGGKEPGANRAGVHAPGVRTDPDEATAYVAATGVDALAVAVGSEHKMLERVAELDVDLVARLARAVPVPLVLHGSSGVSDDGLRRAVMSGITKVNVATQLNKAFTAAVRASLERDPSLVDTREYLGAGRRAMADEVERLLGVLSP
jgi:fructose-bisphosphate aldolase class II